MVAPKRARLKEAESKLSEQMGNLEERRAVLKEITDKLDKLNNKLNMKQTEKKVSCDGMVLSRSGYDVKTVLPLV